MRDTIPSNSLRQVTPVSLNLLSMHAHVTFFPPPGYSACFLGTIQAVATKQGKKDVGAQAVVHADVSLGRPTDRSGFGLEVVLRVEGVEDQTIIDAAHEVCKQICSLHRGLMARHV
jgi:uncharacterized OsmC-like protein